LLSRILSNAGLIFATSSCTLFLQSAAFFSGSMRQSPPEQWIAADMRTLALGRCFQGTPAWEQLL